MDDSPGRLCSHRPASDQNDEDAWELKEDWASFPHEHVLPESVNTRFTCAICMDTMEDPVFLIPCGHTFGEDCIVRLLMDRPYMFSCPFGCTIDTSRKYAPAHDLKHLIRESVKTKCVSRGCPKVLRIEQLPTHLRNTCAHATYECTLKDSTGAVCGRLVEARERAGHRLVCQHRPAQCTHEGCGKTLAKVDLAFHLEECGFRQQACDFCEKVFAAKDLAEHVRVCPEAEEECTLCKSVVLRRLLPTHYQAPEFMGLHVRGLAEQMSRLGAAKTQEQEAAQTTLDVRSEAPPLPPTEPGVSVVDVHSRVEMTWVADVSTIGTRPGFDNMLKSAIFTFGGWSFYLSVFKRMDENRSDSYIYLVSCHGDALSTDYSRGYRLQDLSADFELSAPEFGISHSASVTDSSRRRNVMLALGTLFLTANKNVGQIKVRIVMTRVVARLKPI